MANVLSIRLDRQGEDIRRTALLPLYAEEIGLGEQRLAAIGDGYRVGKRRGLGALDHVLEKGDPDLIAQHLAGRALHDAGDALFDAAFGSDEAKWRRCFKRLFGAGASIPAAKPVRLRIVTSDPMLRGFPWALMAYKGDFLRDSGWTFSVDAPDRPTDDPKLDHPKLDLPTGIVLIMPELGRPGDDTASESHCDALTELVDSYMPERHKGQLRVVQTRDELRRALADVRPRIVYYYGRGGDRDPRCSVHDFARALRDTQSKPDLVYLNGGLSGRGLWQSAAAELATVAPVVLAHATAAWTEPAREVASRFFRLLFSAEMDPVEAAILRAPHERIDGAGWMPLLAFAGHRSFEVRYLKPPRPGAMTPVDFDRHKQRQIAAAEIRELSQKPERRVHAFVVVAPPENHAREIAAQLHAYTQRMDVKSELLLGKPIDVSPSMFDRESPADGQGAIARMEEQLKLNRDREPRTEMRDLLVDSSPPRVSSRTRVLWLDFGVLAPARIEDDLRDWLAFCLGRVTEACPGDLRIVVSLAVETPGADVEATRALAKKLVSKYRSPAFRAFVLDPLGSADEDEIRDFLEQTGCQVNLHDDLSRWMHDETGGEYAPLRELIAKAFKTTWVDLHHELGAKHGQVFERSPAPRPAAAPDAGAPAPGMTRDQLHDALCALLAGQLESLVFKLAVPPAFLPGTTAPAAQRVADLLRWAEQQRRVHDVVRLLAEVTSAGTKAR